MKAFLRLKGKIRPEKQLSAVSYQPSILNNQLSELRLWQFIKYCVLDKARFLRIFLQLILVFVSCSAALAQGSVVHTTPAGQAEVAINKTIDQEITPLKIGDKIPDELWEMYFSVVSANSDEVQYLSLGDFKDKLIILDFWATWCAPCISSLHKLDTLQQQLKDDLMVIPTSYESETKIRPFLVNRKIDLPSLIEEKELKKYFPHNSIPHTVWIKDKKLHAITAPLYATESNITNLLEGKDVQMHIKDEIELIKELPLLINNNGGNVDDLLQQSLFTKRLSTGVAGINLGDNYLLAYNLNIGSLLVEAYRPIIENISHKIIWEVDSLLFINPYRIDKSESFDQHFEYENWRNTYVFCYNLILPRKVDYREKLSIMRQELNVFFRHQFGICAEIEEREMKVLVLSKSNPTIEINSKLTKDYTNSISQAHISAKINEFFPKTILINHFDKDFNYRAFFTKEELKNKDKFISKLKELGFSLDYQDRWLKMLVVKNI